MHLIQNELQESLAKVRSSFGAHLRAPGSSIKELAVEVVKVYEIWKLLVEVRIFM